MIKIYVKTVSNRIYELSTILVFFSEYISYMFYMSKSFIDCNIYIYI